MHRVRALLDDCILVVLWTLLSVAALIVRRVRDPLQRHPDRTSSTYWTRPGNAHAP